MLLSYPIWINWGMLDDFWRSERTLFWSWKVNFSPFYKSNSGVLLPHLITSLAFVQLFRYKMLSWKFQCLVICTQEATLFPYQMRRKQLEKVLLVSEEIQLVFEHHLSAKDNYIAWIRSYSLEFFHNLWRTILKI